MARVAVAPAMTEERVEEVALARVALLALFLLQLIVQGRPKFMMPPPQSTKGSSRPTKGDTGDTDVYGSTKSCGSGSSSAGSSAAPASVAFDVGKVPDGDCGSELAKWCAPRGSASGGSAASCEGTGDVGDADTIGVGECSETCACAGSVCIAPGSVPVIVAPGSAEGGRIVFVLLMASEPVAELAGEGVRLGARSDCGVPAFAAGKGPQGSDSGDRGGKESGVYGSMFVGSSCCVRSGGTGISSSSSDGDNGTCGGGSSTGITSSSEVGCGEESDRAYAAAGVCAEEDPMGVGELRATMFSGMTEASGESLGDGRASGSGAGGSGAGGSGGSSAGPAASSCTVATHVPAVAMGDCGGVQGGVQGAAVVPALNIGGRGVPGAALMPAMDAGGRGVPGAALMFAMDVGGCGVPGAALIPAMDVGGRGVPGTAFVPAMDVGGRGVPGAAVIPAMNVGGRGVPGAAVIPAMFVGGRCGAA